MTVEQKIEKQFKAYVNENFDTPSSLKEINLKVFSKIVLIISLIGNAICVFGALMIGAKNILQKSFLPSLW